MAPKFLSWRSIHTEKAGEGAATPQVTLGESLKCLRADSAVDKGSEHQRQPWETIPVHIPSSFQSYRGDFTSLDLVFFP